VRHSVRKSRREAGRSESAARRLVTLGPEQQLPGLRYGAHDLDIWRAKPRVLVATSNDATTLRSIPRDVGRRCHRRRWVSTIVSDLSRLAGLAVSPVLDSKMRLDSWINQRSLHDHGPPTTGDAVEAGILTALPGDSRQSDCRSLLALLGSAFPSPASQVGQEARISPARATVRLQARDQQSRFDCRGVHAKGKKRATSQLRSGTEDETGWNYTRFSGSLRGTDPPVTSGLSRGRSIPVTNWT
jgi:hypothetical protein